MNVVAFLVVIAAWGCTLFWRGGWARVAQLIVFGLLGAVFTLAGGFQYWWNSGMKPTDASPFLFGCGVLTLLSQAGTILIAVFSNEGGMPWPGEETPRRPRPPRSHRRPPT
jgi:hypothetical protein